MTIICKKSRLAIDKVKPELDSFISELGKRAGYFGSTDTGACIAVLGSVQIPPEIKEILNSERGER